MSHEAIIAVATTAGVQWDDLCLITAHHITITKLPAFVLGTDAAPGTGTPSDVSTRTIAGTKKLHALVPAVPLMFTTDVGSLGEMGEHQAKQH